ncbi:multicopper oxidase domain-containing protein [Jonesia quinghaiensis]|uniref:multicopper oxidase domain-containing protein n=1 Tax=Jonesia quinghaiensis TaxID=262806 RepID=UPI00056698FA|nr:multicopper oxidase domain-containing protein [Jonesia quinghaiensis]
MRSLPIAHADSARPTSRGFQPMRDLPAVVWLVLAVVATLVHQWVPAPRWLMLHLVFLGAISHSILVWSQHFAVALLHAQITDVQRRHQTVRLVLLNAGTVVVIVGVLGMWWPVTAVGASAIGAGVLWHGVSLWRRLRSALGTRFASTVHFYTAAAVFLPVGAVLGTLLSHGFADPTHAQVKFSHALLNVLGWMGLTILGTLITLWPTILRTKLRDDSLPAARRALPVLVGGVVIASAGSLVGWLWLVAVGLAVYIAGVVVLEVPLVRTAWSKRPVTFAAQSVAASQVWLVGCLVYLTVWVAIASPRNDWVVAQDHFTWITPFLAAGVALPVLVGALSYLVPVSVSRGPASARAANQVMDRGAWFRITATHGALIVCALPVPSIVRVAASLLYVGVMASFLVLMVQAMRAAKQAQRDPSAHLAAPEHTGPMSATGDRPRGQLVGQAATGLIAVALTVVVGVIADPSALGQTALGQGADAGRWGVSVSGGVVGDSAAHDVPATGDTVTVDVEARDMRFFPDSITVNPGDQLVINLTNTDGADVHDLVLANGAKTGRIAPGDSATLDAGVVSGALDGWCSIVGHKNMGMVFTVLTSGEKSTQPSADDSSDAPTDSGTDHSAMGHGTTGTDGAATDSAATDFDPMATPPADFTARDASLPPLSPAPSDGSPTVHRETFEIVEKDIEVAPGVTQRLWTFNGAAPGPTLHGRVGDIFEITLVNNGSMGHSIDFHASNLAPDGPMRTIPPGESLVYRFTAERAGIWMYHCGTMPMTAHIANGMAGAVIIEPDDLPAVDRSYVLTQSEFYLGPQGGTVDVDRALSGGHAADVVAFNGYASQYAAHPLTAVTGERVRVWVLDIGPNKPSSFHIVGGQFDRVWFEGQYILGSEKGPADPANGGSQALGMQAAQGGFVELTFPEAGNYPFVTHIMADAEMGARGVFSVSAR